MAHIAACLQPAANIAASLPGSTAEAWQQKQGGSRPAQQQQQPACSRREQRAEQPARRSFHHAAFVSEHSPSVQQKPLLQRRRCEFRHNTECRLGLEQASAKISRQLIGASLALEAQENRVIARKVLQGLPAAAVFWASEVARAAEELEKPVVIPNDDELPNKIIAVLFTLGVLALSTLTLGVSTRRLPLGYFREKSIAFASLLKPAYKLAVIWAPHDPIEDRAVMCMVCQKQDSLAGCFAMLPSCSHCFV